MMLDENVRRELLKVSSSGKNVLSLIDYGNAPLENMKLKISNRRVLPAIDYRNVPPEKMKVEISERYVLLISKGDQHNSVH